MDYKVGSFTDKTGSMCARGGDILSREQGTTRKDIFQEYHRLRKNVDKNSNPHVTQGQQLSLRYQFYEKIYKKYYKNILESCGVSRMSSILEVGCNIGGMLGALQKDGYSDLYGIDLSVNDVEIAKRNLPGAKLTIGDALDPDSYAKEEFDVIMCRATLEHVEKSKVFDFLELLYTHLRRGGVLVIDVPNMDWFWASHERYMDFTHGCGFTKESLDEVLLCFFDKVEFVYEDILEYSGKKDWWKRKIAKKVLWYLYSQAGVFTTEENLFSRSVIAYAQKS